MSGAETQGAGGGETGRKSPLRRWGLRVGIAVLGVAIFGIGIFIVVMRMTAEPERVVRDFMAQAAAGEYAAAHAHFSAPLQQVQPLEAFGAMVQANAMYFQVTDLSFNQRSIDEAGAEFAGSVTLESGTELPATFSLVREREDWKLIKYYIGS